MVIQNKSNLPDSPHSSINFWELPTGELTQGLHTNTLQGSVLFAFAVPMGTRPGGTKTWHRPTSSTDIGKFTLGDQSKQPHKDCSLQ